MPSCNFMTCYSMIFAVSVFLFAIRAYLVLQVEVGRRDASPLDSQACQMFERCSIVTHDHTPFSPKPFRAHPALVASYRGDAPPLDSQARQTFKSCSIVTHTRPHFFLERLGPSDSCATEFFAKSASNTHVFGGTKPCSSHDQCMFAIRAYQVISYSPRPFQNCNWMAQRLLRALASTLVDHISIISR